MMRNNKNKGECIEEVISNYCAIRNSSNNSGI